MNEVTELIDRLTHDADYTFESLEIEDETVIVLSWSRATRLYQRHLFDLDGNYIDTETV